MYVSPTTDGRMTGSASQTTAGQHPNQLAREPIARVPTLVYAASLAVAALTAIVSAVGLASGSLYAADPVPGAALSPPPRGCSCRAFRPTTDSISSSGCRFFSAWCGLRIAARL